MKNLSNIPEKFHILFQSDWSNGNESELSSTERNNLHSLYLEYNRWSINNSINPPSTKEEINNPIGFPKD
jgi:hypothetical protein